MLLDETQNRGCNLGIVIDLTNTLRYYHNKVYGFTTFRICFVYVTVYPLRTTTAAISWPKYRITCISWYCELRTGGLLQWSFIVHMPLLMTASTFGFGFGVNPLSAFCCTASESRHAVPYWRTRYVIFSLTQCNVWHMPTLLLQLWLGTGHKTLLLGWATFGPLLNCVTIITQLLQKRQCYVTGRHFHCKYRTYGAKARPQKRTMGVNSLPKTVTRQRRGCDLNPRSSAPESSTLTTRLPSHPIHK